MKVAAPTATQDLDAPDHRDNLYSRSMDVRQSGSVCDMMRHPHAAPHPEATRLIRRRQCHSRHAHFQTSEMQHALPSWAFLYLLWSVRFSQAPFYSLRPSNSVRCRHPGVLDVDVCSLPSPCPRSAWGLYRALPVSGPALTRPRMRPPPWRGQAASATRPRCTRGR